MKAVIFIGPTLRIEQAERHLAATYRPPAAQGDILAAAKQQPTAIGIIDGYFHHVPSVRHKEVLVALESGIHIFGSASMGALRAAELHSFGMRGVGRIFADFADGSLIADDEVAVTHGPAELGYPVLSEPLVNVRATLDRAVAEEIISDETQHAILKCAAEIFFPKRTFETILAATAALGVAKREIAAFQVWLADGYVDQKALDAAQMLQEMARFLETEPAPFKVPYYVEPTLPIE